MLECILIMMYIVKTYALDQAEKTRWDENKHLNQQSIGQVMF